MTRINIRQKGQTGEREICDALNPIIQKVMRQLNYGEQEIVKAAQSIQRNQNQSAVGGNDLSNTFGMSIEVKRQEALSINEWWRQCVLAADRNNEHPVLLYRQNRKKWKCVTYAYLQMPETRLDYDRFHTRVEMEWDAFLKWFELWVYLKLQAGHEVRS